MGVELVAGMPNREVVRFAEVAVDAPAGHDRTFSYSIPPSLGAKIGQFVIVPENEHQGNVAMQLGTVERAS